MKIVYWGHYSPVKMQFLIEIFIPDMDYTWHLLLKMLYVD